MKQSSVSEAASYKYPRKRGIRNQEKSGSEGTASPFFTKSVFLIQRQTGTDKEKGDLLLC